MRKKKVVSVIVISAAAIVLATVISTHGQSFKYEAKGKRDPFLPLVGQERQKASSLADIISIEDAVLEGIAIGAAGQKMAMINGEMVKEGDKAGEVLIKHITKSSVTLSIGGKDFNLKLPEEGGPKK